MFKYVIMISGLRSLRCVFLFSMRVVYFLCQLDDCSAHNPLTYLTRLHWERCVENVEARQGA